MESRGVEPEGRGAGGGGRAGAGNQGGELRGEILKW